MLPPSAGAFVSGGWRNGEGIEGAGGARLEGWRGSAPLPAVLGAAAAPAIGVPSHGRLRYPGPGAAQAEPEGAICGLGAPRVPGT